MRASDRGGVDSGHRLAPRCPSFVPRAAPNRPLGRTLDPRDPSRGEAWAETRDLDSGDFEQADDPGALAGVGRQDLEHPGVVGARLARERP